MLMKWLGCPYIKRADELLLIIHELGMVSPEQVSKLMRIDKKSVVKTVYRLNQQGAMVISHQPPKTFLSKRAMFTFPRMYSLGLDGKKAVEEFLGVEIHHRKFSARNWRHFHGMNETLLKLVETMGHEEAVRRMEWYNSRQARDHLFRLVVQQKGQNWDEQTKKEQRNLLIAPDGRIEIDGRGFWFEYDNDTEKPEEIEGKMKRYVHTLLMAANREPVLWVAPNQKRTRELAEWWQGVQADPIYQPFIGEPGFYFPDMYFLSLEDVPSLVKTRKAQAM